MEVGGWGELNFKETTIRHGKRHKTIGLFWTITTFVIKVFVELEKTTDMHLKSKLYETFRLLIQRYAQILFFKKRSGISLSTTFCS